MLLGFFFIYFMRIDDMKTRAFKVNKRQSPVHRFIKTAPGHLHTHLLSLQTTWLELFSLWWGTAQAYGFLWRLFNEPTVVQPLQLWHSGDRLTSAPVLFLFPDQCQAHWCDSAMRQTSDSDLVTICAAESPLMLWFKTFWATTELMWCWP